jgi:hypothetical protein
MLHQTRTELKKLRVEKAKWERKEKDYLAKLSKLEDKVTDREAKCRQL